MGLALLVAPCLAPRHCAPDDGKGFEPIFVQNLDLGELAPDGKSVGSISCAAWIHTQLPRCSMYGIFTHMYHKLRPNVGTYTVHGASGHVFSLPNQIQSREFVGCTPGPTVPRHGKSLSPISRGV